MDHLINKFISKKLRKKGENYLLSENSKSTAHTFGQLSSIASKIYQYLIAISPRLRDGGVFNGLVALLRQMRNNDQTLSEEEAAIYTHANMLAGFSLNKRASWDTLLPWRPQFDFDADQQVQVSLPLQKNWTLKNFPVRLSRIEITFHIIVINLEQPKEKETTVHTKALFVHPHDKDRSLRTILKPVLFTESLILVIGVARYHLFDTDGTRNSVSGSALYNATDIMQTFHVRDGRLLKDAPISRNALPPLAPDLGEGSSWE